jgi:predicted Fe-S protein YdhL (DUF1289 family)
MDAEQLYCAGCARTLAEIARWGEMNDAERAAVLGQLQGRCRQENRASMPELSQRP